MQNEREFFFRFWFTRCRFDSTAHRDWWEMMIFYKTDTAAWRRKCDEQSINKNRGQKHCSLYFIFNWNIHWCVVLSFTFMFMQRKWNQATHKINALVNWIVIDGYKYKEKVSERERERRNGQIVKLNMVTIKMLWNVIANKFEQIYFSRYASMRTTIKHTCVCVLYIYIYM